MTLPEMSEHIGLNRSETAKEMLRDAYLADGRPWVVAFSGGKDSTLVLQLVYETLIGLGKLAKKRVYVISSDTRVEAPNVASYVENVLKAIEEDATAQHLPLSCHLVRPKLSETFWSKLIGRGYPPPTRWFRWCTTNMKIKPSRKEIEKITAEHGSVILLLGSRKAESSDRKKTMIARNNNFRNLNTHHEIPNAYVMAPISDWEDDDVWEYLYENNPPPWNRPHDQMLTLYRQAVGGECPVVMDLNTPSCGGSRFGCWTCTVVKMDKSMEGFIETGEEWMTPLAEFRNWLKEYREIPKTRMTRRRDGSEGPGPFTPQAREEILERLLNVESQVGIPLISDDEIRYIQGVWSSEFDLIDRAEAIAFEHGRELAGVNDVPLDEDERSILEDIVAERGLSPDLVGKILALESEFPNLDRWGAKAALKRNLEELIQVAESQEATGE
jgi:DNA sulfur modification protein DndC